MTYRNIHRFEDEIYGCLIRRCGIFDSKGEKLLDRQENFYKFAFSELERKGMKGKNLIYNAGEEVFTLFAKDMVELAITVQLKELRVVSESGTYSLISPSLKWPTKNAIFNTFHFTACDDNLHNKKYWEQKHIRWEIAAKKLGLKYQRFPQKPCLNVSSEETICD